MEILKFDTNYVHERFYRTEILTEKGHEIKDFPILWLGDATTATKTVQVYAFWQVYYNSSQALSRLHENKVSAWFGDGHAALHSKEEINSQETSLDGLTFVITGKLNHFKNRDAIKNKIEALGGKVTGSVSKNTNYLINNDKNSTSSKNKSALSLGVSILTEEDFIKMFEVE